MKNIIFIILFLGFTVGCLRTRKDIQQTSPQPQDEQAMEVKVQQLTDDEKFTQLDEQMRELRGKVEESHNTMATQAKQLKEIQDQQKIEQEILDNRFKLYTEAISKLEQQFIELKTHQAQRSKKSRKTKTKKITPFTRAEGYFKEKKWKAAIVEYQKYREAYPKGKHYRVTTYKIGVCFQELKMKAEARAFFEEVIEKYPKSKEDKKSRYRLKKLREKVKSQ